MIIYKSRALCFLFCTLCFSFIKSQSILFPADYFFDVQRQKETFTDTSIIVHSSVQPVIYKDMLPDTFKRLKPGEDPFYDKVFFENLIQVRYTDKSSGSDMKFKMDINPIFNFSAGKDLKDTTKKPFFNNTRGVWIKGAIGNKFIFETSFFENQSTFPTYLRSYCNATNIVPGQGRWKTFKTNGFDYAMACGVINYQPSKNFSIRLGTGKQKVGVGYRSLLLSDNSFNYPYLQFTANFFKQKVLYSQTYALLMNDTTGGTKQPKGAEGILQKKAASFQQVSFHISKRINLYLFQGLIWKATDNDNIMHLNPLYANPIIFTNLAAYGFNNDNHILVGGGWEMKPFKKTSFYGQFMYDGSYQNKTNMGAQGGIKFFDLLHIKNLYLQYEYNYVSKNSYVEAKNPTQDYSHYNQLLTTPAPFSNEMIGVASYTFKKFFIQVKENYSFGDNSSLQKLYYFDAKIGYTINPCYQANISVGTTMRTYENKLIHIENDMRLFYISFKTSLYNVYYDF